MIRARRVALKMKWKGKILERKAWRIAKDVAVKLARKIETCEERYDLSRSAVTGAFEHGGECVVRIVGSGRRRVSVWRLPIAYEADGGAGGRPEDTSTLQVAERASVLLEDHSWYRHCERDWKAPRPSHRQPIPMAPSRVDRVDANS